MRYVRISTLGRPIEIQLYATAFAPSALSGAQRSQAEQCRPVWQRTRPAPFRARRAVGSLTRASASDANQASRALPSRVVAYASSALSGAQSSRQLHTSERLRRKSSRQSRTVPRGSERFQHPFGRAEQSAAAHERAPPTQIKQAEPCRPVWQRTLPAPFQARRAVGNRTRANASRANHVGRALPSLAAADASNAFSGAQSSRQPHTSERLPRKSSRQSISVVCGRVRIRRRFGRAKQSAAAHERTRQLR